MTTKKIESLVKLRDAYAMASEALNDLIDSMAPKEIKEEQAVNENTFLPLKFEPQQGAKLGSYEVAYKANNPEDKWTSAYNVLSKTNASIQARYHGKDYQFAYWLYGDGKIYRQKRKEAAL